jgi:hypothetical protein
MDKCYCVNVEFDGSVAIEQLRRLPVQVDVNRGPMNSCRSDWKIALVSKSGRSDYFGEAKRTVTTTTVPTVISQLMLQAEGRARPLLLTPYVTRGVAEELRAAKVEYVDAEGNLYLDGPAIVAFVSGNRPKKRKTSGFSSTDMRVLYAMLADPPNLGRPLRELSSRIGVSIGAISNTFKKLEQLDLLYQAGGSRVLINPRRLLERWEVGYAEQLRSSLHPTGWRLPPNSTRADLLDRLIEVPEVRLGGELAAATYLPNAFTPGSIALHVSTPDHKNWAARLRLLPGHDERMPVSILDYLHGANERASKGNAAHPILARAEMLVGADSRVMAVADRLLREHILPALDDG